MGIELTTVITNEVADKYNMAKRFAYLMIFARFGTRLQLLNIQ